LTSAYPIAIVATARGGGGGVAGGLSALPGHLGGGQFDLLADQNAGLARQLAQQYSQRAILLSHHDPSNWRL
jgi:hypothetical protein